MRLIHVLKSKKGASLVLVVAVMFFLLALSTAAFTAAGINRGAGQAQRDRNQLELYASSMERTVRYALEQGWAIEDADVESLGDTLGGVLLLEVYKNRFDPAYTDGTILVDMTIASDDIGVPSAFSGQVKYTIHITSASAANTETFYFIDNPRDSCEVDIDGFVLHDYCVPRSVLMSGELRVTITTVYDIPAEDTLPRESISMETATTYRISGIRIEEDIDDADCATATDVHGDAFNPPMVLIDEAVWEVLRHAKVSS